MSRTLISKLVEGFQTGIISLKESVSQCSELLPKYNHIFSKNNLEEINSSTKSPTSSSSSPAPLLEGILFDVKDQLDHQYLVTAAEGVGAISLGQTVRPPEGAFPACPGVWNLLDSSLTAGGSTAGGAVSVATGLSSFSIGSDGGGSIRIPASFSGLYGMTVEKGLAVVGGGREADSPSLPGLLTRSVDDMSYVIEALTERRYGFNPIQGSPYSDTDPVRVLIISEIEQMPSQLIPNFPEVQLNESTVLTHWREAIERLRLSTLDESKILFTKAETVNIKLPNITQSFLIKWMDYLRDKEASPSTDQGLPRDDDTVLTAAQMMRRYITGPIEFYGEEWTKMTERATKELGQARRQLFAIFENYDLVLTPSLLCPPWSYRLACPSFKGIDGLPDGLIDSRFNPYFVLFNILPAVALSGPCNFDQNDLPVGYHLATVTSKKQKGLATEQILNVTRHLAKSNKPFLDKLESRMRSKL